MGSGTPVVVTEDTLASDDQSELTVPGESARSSMTRTLTEQRRLGHYLLLDELGRGGMGVVYVAHDSKLGRKVAIKMLAAEGDAKLQHRLIREAKAMAKLTHPNVVSVHEIGEHEGAAFIVMEYVEGSTLRRWLAAQPRSIAEIVAAFMAAGRGLEAIHAAGLVHRDFKPDNLMIRDSGQVLVMDLGIARGDSKAFRAAMPELEGADDAPVELTREGTLMGSPGYMAAEQFNGGEVTPKTDQFSFCVSLWEALYGERPFDGSNLVTLVDAVTSGRVRAPKRSEVPTALRSVLERGLQVEHGARFESMAALLDAIERTANPRARASKRLAWGAGLVAALALAFVGVPAALDDQHAPPDATPSEEPAQQAEPPGEPPRHRQITTSGTASVPALSPDGDHLVFPDGARLMHVDLRSGETRELAPEVENVYTSQLSSDGSFLFSGMLRENYGVYRMPSLDGTPVPVSGVLPLFCQFPNRGSIASIKYPAKAVTLSDANGERIAEIPVEGEYEWLLAVACDPRHNRVVVLHLLGSTHTLKLIDLDGGPARVLFEGSSKLTSPQFDSAGSTLYYLAKHVDGKTNLEATQVAANDDLPVTRVVVPDIDALAFSRADSGRIAFVRTRTIQHGIWRLDATDTSLDRAKHIVDTDADEVLFAVSPDETQLAYVESRNNLGRLMIRSLSDESEREITRGDGLRHIAWSPDGRTIAFIAQYRGQAYVWTVPAEGGAPKVFKRALASETPLAWAPSEQIIYERPENRNFGVLDPITEDDRTLIADDTVGWAFDPIVSPDGESVAVFWNRRSEGPGAWTIDIARGTPRMLAEGRYYPITWSPDGQYLYIEEGHESPLKIHRVSASSGAREPWRTVDFGPRRQPLCWVLSTRELLCSVIETSSDIWIGEAVE